MESEKKSSVQLLKEYFDNKTSKELEKDFEEIQSMNLGGPSVDDFLKSIERYNELRKRYLESNEKIQKEIEKTINNFISNKVLNKEEIKTQLLDLINSIFDVTEFLKLQHHYDTTIGIEVVDINPKDILHSFWNSSSDICPLEVSEQEKQEKAFEEWISKYTYTL